MEGDCGGGVKNMGWTNCDIQDFAFPFQLPPVDFRVETSNGFCGFTGLDDIIPMADHQMFLSHHFYSSPSKVITDHDYTLLPDLLHCDSGSGSSRFWDHEMKIGLEEKPTEHVQNQQLVLFDNNNNNNNNISYNNGALVENVEEKKVGNKRPRKVKNGSKMKALSLESISQYFYMPITKAARELNVGLTRLKMRCRDLGIRRWPHRKLNSLQNLITKVQESEREGCSSGEGNKLNEYDLRVLEQEKKMLEKVPDTQLDVGTRRLRQAFFKAKYKKRKLLDLVDSSSSSSTKEMEPSTNLLVGGVVDYGFDDEYDDEIKYLLEDCFSCV